MRHVWFVLRQIAWDFETNLLVRPAMFLIGSVGLALFSPAAERMAEARWPAVAQFDAWVALEPATAQLLMATVASSVMTVVSVVYSILVVALALASMQFSTRILAGFTRDSLSRTVLGLFVGTFAYCLALIRAIHADPPVVPTISVLGGLALAFTALGAMVLFIHHIVRSIQANVLVDRIATSAEGVIADVFRELPGPDGGPLPAMPHAARSIVSGYVQLIDVDGLVELAAGRTLAVRRSMGAFVPAGMPLVASDHPIDPALASALVGCVDIGPERTLHEDVEFGFRQIVDIALKAVSPAVNDPSTAATCVDHLGRLLIRVATLPAPRTWFGTASGRVYVPNTEFNALLDLSVDQLRQYGRTDMATCLRLMRVLAEVAPFVRDPAHKERILEHAGAIVKGAEGAFVAHDCDELHRRYATLRECLGVV